MGNEDGVASDAGVAEAVARVELSREVEAEDALDSSLADKALQADLGDDFPTAQRMLQSYVRGLPDHERSQISPETFQNPVLLRALGEKALGPLPEDPAGQEKEIAEAKRRMASDKTWFADDRAQLRYRQLLRLTGQAKADD